MSQLGREISLRELLSSSLKSEVDQENKTPELPDLSRIVDEIEASELALTVLFRLINGLFLTIKYYRYQILNGKGDDPERVHDFRVNTRRLRSLLFECKDKFSDEEFLMWNAGLKVPVKACNKLRDLDVFVEVEAEYLKRTPPTLKKAAVAFFADLRQKRDKENERFEEFLKGESCEQLFRE